MYAKAQEFISTILLILLFYKNFEIFCTQLLEKISILKFRHDVNYVSNFFNKTNTKESDIENMNNVVEYFNKKILDLHISVKNSNMFIPVSPLSFSESKECLCGSSYNSTKYYETEQIQCTNCGLILHNPYSIAWSDLSRVHASPVYIYDRKVQFKDCILQFQGKCGPIDVDLLKNISISKNINKIEFTKYLKKVTKNRAQLDQIHSLYYYYTGKIIPDLSSIETILLKDFDKFSELYTSKNVKGHFVSNNFLLFQFLKRYNFLIKPDDLLLNEIKYDENCQNCFQELNWPIFTS
jgi:hypothetical protein